MLDARCQSCVYVWVQEYHENAPNTKQNFFPYLVMRKFIMNFKKKKNISLFSSLSFYFWLDYTLFARFVAYIQNHNTHNA